MEFFRAVLSPSTYASVPQAITGLLLTVLAVVLACWVALSVVVYFVSRWRWFARQVNFEQRVELYDKVERAVGVFSAMFAALLVFAFLPDTLRASTPWSPLVGCMGTSAAAMMALDRLVNKQFPRYYAWLLAKR